MTNRCRLSIAFACLLLTPAALQAQGFGGGPPDPGRIFDFMDSNRDGRLDRDEIDNGRGGFLRDRLREAKVDYSRGLSKDDFVKTMERARSSSDGDRGGSDRGGDDRGRDDRNRDDERRREEERRRDDDRGRDSGSRDSRSPSGTPAVPARIPVSLGLQQTFKDGDKDFDGQIGFYEWRTWKGRAQSAEFARLDMNGDGFVTPREIERAGTAPAAVPGTPAGAAQVVSVTTPQRGGAPDTASISAPAAAAAPAPATPATAVAIAGPAPDISGIVIDEDNASVRRYRSTFKLLDRDGSGTLSVDEWERSTNYRGRFNAGKVDITQPMDGDTFVKHLLKMDADAANASGAAG